MADWLWTNDPFETQRDEEDIPVSIFENETDGTVGFNVAGVGLLTLDPHEAKQIGELLKVSAAHIEMRDWKEKG